MPLRGLLFDVDGTLLDTREFILAAFEHAAEVHGLRLPSREVIAGHIGRPLDAIYADFAGAGAGAEAAVETHRAFQRRSLALVQAFPGVADTLARLRDQGLLLAAVSSRSHRSMLPSLEHGGILRLLDTVVAAEDAPALKPDPAPLLVALARLELLPCEALMVGDTAYDIEAGHALGMSTVAVTYGLHGDRVLSARPSWRIDDIRELPDLVHRSSGN